MWEQQALQVVWNRASLYGRYLDEYYQSEYYNDFVVPNRAYDSIGISVSVNSPAGPGPSSIASLFFHHDRPNARPFGARGMALLHLLLPAIRAGVHAHVRFGESRARLGSLLDASGATLFVYDLAGRELHRTRRLIDLLVADPEAHRLEGLVRDLASTLGRLSRSNESQPGNPAESVCRELRTRTARYKLYGTYADPEVLGAGAGVLVSVERATPEPLSAEEIRECFGLTSQEFRVAQLLMTGRSNADLANELCISIHTARHHVERVKSKLGVRFRAEVSAKILRLQEGCSGN